jgi:hypothetical protein
VRFSAAGAKTQSFASVVEVRIVEKLIAICCGVPPRPWRRIRACVASRGGAPYRKVLVLPWGRVRGCWVVMGVGGRGISDILYYKTKVD